jgi:hypothetical protein
MKSRPVALVTGVSLSMGTLLGNMEGAPLPGTLEGKIKRDILSER